MSTRETRPFDETRRRFLAVVSHELRTPLASIQAALGLLDQRQGELSEQARELVSIARRNGERLSQLVEDILDLQRFESGQLRFYPGRCPIAEVLQEVMADQRTAAEAGGVELVLRDRAPEARVHADRQRLLQALKRLVANAVRLSPAGSTVVLEVEHSPHGLRITVRDAGAGKPTRTQRELFAVPAWGEMPAKHVSAGLGLGLDLARAIIVGMAGSLGAREDARGTTIVVELPLSSEHDQAAEAAEAPLVAASAPR